MLSLTLLEGTQRTILLVSSSSALFGGVMSLLKLSSVEKAIRDHRAGEPEAWLQNVEPLFVVNDELVGAGFQTSF